MSLLHATRDVRRPYHKSWEIGSHLLKSMKYEINIIKFTIVLANIWFNCHSAAFSQKQKNQKIKLNEFWQRFTLIH